MIVKTRQEILRSWGIQPPLAFVLYPLAEAGEIGFRLEDGAHIAVMGGSGYTHATVQRMLIEALNRRIFVLKEGLFFWNDEYTPDC